jgi:hypothetical protein
MTLEYGLKCPLCGSWYCADPEFLLFFEEGEICGNQSGKGTNPKLCCTEHPCEGKLVPITREEYKD